MAECFFVSDIHGQAGRWAALCAAIDARRPAAVFVGGDLLPFGGGHSADPRSASEPERFLEDVAVGGLERVQHISFALFGAEERDRPAFLLGEASEGHNPGCPG